MQKMESTIWVQFQLIVATINSVLASGTKYVVTFDGYFNKGVVSVNQIKPVESAKQDIPIEKSDIVEGNKVKAKYGQN